MKIWIIPVAIAALASLSGCDQFSLRPEPTFDDEDAKAYPECRYDANWDDLHKLVERRDEAEEIENRIWVAFNSNALELQEGEEMVYLEDAGFATGLEDILGGCAQKADKIGEESAWFFIYQYSFSRDLFELNGKTEKGRMATYNVSVYLKEKKYRIQYYYTLYNWTTILRSSAYFSFDEQRQAKLIALAASAGCEVERLSSW